MIAPLKKIIDKLRQHIKKQRTHFADKGSYSQSCGFSSSEVWMWELDCKEGWGLKNWYFWTVMLGKPLESPLGTKEIKQINPKGNQLWIFIGRTDGEVEALILRPPGGKSWLIGKDSEAGTDWEQEKKGVTDGEMVGWHHWLNGHKFEQTLGDNEGQGSLMCCSLWGCEESYMTEQLNNSNNKILTGNTVQCRYSICWLQWPQTPLIPCPIPCLESRVQGVHMETGITGPEGQQACTAQHTKIREHRTRVWGEECKQVEQRNQSPGCGDRSGRAVIPTSLPSEPGPNTHTHTHTHTHTAHRWVWFYIPLLVAAEAWNHMVGEPAGSLLLRPKVSQKIFVTYALGLNFPLLPSATFLLSKDPTAQTWGQTEHLVFTEKLLGRRMTEVFLAVRSIYI